MEKCADRTFQAEGTASAKAMQWEFTWRTGEAASAAGAAGEGGSGGDEEGDEGGEGPD